MKQEIWATDTKRISSFLANNNIKSDFKGNKTIAWCTYKSIELLKNLNKKYNLDLDLPKGIFVEDFSKLNISTRAIATTNYAPTYLYKDLQKIIPEKIIFFNILPNENYTHNNNFWEEIDTRADEYYATGIYTTNFFLELFLHEMMHVAHIGNLLKYLNPSKYILELQKIKTNEYLTNYVTKYAELSSICDYALNNPLEAIACDLSKRIINNLDKDVIAPKQNIILNSPYTTQNILEKIFSKDSFCEKALRRFWNGKFD